MLINPPIDYGASCHNSKIYNIVFCWIMYRNKNLTIAAIIMAALLGTGIFSTTTMAAYAERDYDDDNYDDNHDDDSGNGDSSEISSEQKFKQNNDGDGILTNCGQNVFQAGATQNCRVLDEEEDGGNGGNGGNGDPTCDECIATFLDSIDNPAVLALVEAALVACVDLTTEAQITALITALGLIVGVDAGALAILEACLLTAAGIAV
jgi:hypothetical protein